MTGRICYPDCRRKEKRRRGTFVRCFMNFPFPSARREYAAEGSRDKIVIIALMLRRGGGGRGRDIFVLALGG